ncbi:hypothetical protein SAMN04488156_12218 [Bacillus sp. 166amftsu]|nr:hypothetical protein SAMN04488156_12218 [Bacillus sp. 166amftsu]
MCSYASYSRYGGTAYNTKRIEELKAGVQLSRKKLTPEILRNTTMHVLSNGFYTENSYEIGESLKNAERYNKAADEIETFK